MGALIFPICSSIRDYVEVEDMFRGAPINDKNQFNYYEFTKILKHGSKDANESSA